MVSKTVITSFAFGRRERNRDFTYFVQKANEFKSMISVIEGNRKANAKSLLGVMALELSEGMSVTLTADGPDEAEAINQLIALLV